MNHLSLFSGVGMLDRAMEAFGFKTIATAEIDPFNRSVLAARFPDASHYDDVRHVTRTALALDYGVDEEQVGVDLVSGGFPCQDLSVAGKGAGLAGERSGLWREFQRIIRELRPRYVLIENVAALRSRGLNALLNDLHYLGYDARWDCIPAAAVGAPHMRDRVWIACVRRDGEPEGHFPQAGIVGYVGPERDGVLSVEDDSPVTALPRAGEQVNGVVAAHNPRATQRDCKRALREGEMLLPSPAAQNPGWKHITVVDREGNPPAHPNQRFYHSETGRVVEKGVEQIAKLFPHLKPASHPLFPTPTRSDGSGGPGTTPKREGGKNLRTVANELTGGSLNPEWVEWMMGLPFGWTDPETLNDDLRPFPGWHEEPQGVPRTVSGPRMKNRAKRIRALGNGLVPQAAAVAFDVLIPTESEDR